MTCFQFHLRATNKAAPKITKKAAFARLDWAHFRFGRLRSSIVQLTPIDLISIQTPFSPCHTMILEASKPAYVVIYQGSKVRTSSAVAGFFQAFVKWFFPKAIPLRLRCFFFDGERFSHLNKNST